MLAVPACLILAPCSPPSRTLRAASGGGLAAILDRGCARRWHMSGWDGETAHSRTEKHHLRSWQPNLLNLTHTTC
jgi:hypothetical protein